LTRICGKAQIKREPGGCSNRDAYTIDAPRKRKKMEMNKINSIKIKKGEGEIKVISR